MLPKAFLSIYSFKYNPIKQSPNHFLFRSTPALPDPVMLPSMTSHPIPSSFYPSVSGISPIIFILVFIILYRFSSLHRDFCYLGSHAYRQYARVRDQRGIQRRCKLSTYPRPHPRLCSSSLL